MSFTDTSRLQGTYTRFVVERGPHWSSAVFSYVVHLQTDRQMEAMARLLQKYWVTYIPHTLTHSYWDSVLAPRQNIHFILFVSSPLQQLTTCVLCDGWQPISHRELGLQFIFFHCLTSHCTTCCRHSISMVACKQRKIM